MRGVTFQCSLDFKFKTKTIQIQKSKCSDFVWRLFSGPHCTEQIIVRILNVF